jgi:integrase
MASYKINFTKAIIQKIEPPKKNDDKEKSFFDTYYDLKEKGLILIVSKGGTKTFYLYQKINNRPERIKLGRFPDLSIENARQLAIHNKSMIALGKNPQEEKNKIRSEITFGELFQEFMERYSKKHKKSWAYDEREVKKFLSHWFNRRISQISKQEIQVLHEKIHDVNGLYQANRLLERIRAIYNKAIEWGWEGVNPTVGIKKYKEKSRERFLRSDELPRFFEALAADDNTTVKDYILLSLLTGARKSNVLAMRWEQINFTLGEWHIPETKNGEQHRIPLSPVALEILENRRQHKEGDYVFCGTGVKGHLVDPKKAWQRILKHAGIEDLRLHDLRRTLGSWMAASGATTAMIGKTLAHKSQQATKIYERLDLDPVRVSINAAHEAIFTAAGIHKQG